MPFISKHSLALPWSYWKKNLGKQTQQSVLFFLNFPTVSNEQLDLKTTKYFEYSL